MPLPPDYDEALRALGRAVKRYEVPAPRRRAVLVGGAAVSLYTDGAVLSGDFDMVISPDTDAEFNAAMATEGFRVEDRPGYLHAGWYHPDHPKYGFQLVTGPLFGGYSDPAKVVRLDIDEESAICVASVEDLIADRLGQQETIRSPMDLSMEQQAKLLKKLAPSLDVAYLSRRVHDEQGNLSRIGL
jgi:hypothetical protein